MAQRLHVEPRKSVQQQARVRVWGCQLCHLLLNAIKDAVFGVANMIIDTIF